MSVLIKGMEMPPVGTGKVIMIDSDGDVWAGGKDEYTIIAGATAVPVPPHGRLIDANELGKRIKVEGTNQAEQLATRFDPVVRAYGDCYGMVLSAPTIIEAEGEE